MIIIYYGLLSMNYITIIVIVLAQVYSYTTSINVLYKS